MCKEIEKNFNVQSFRQRNTQERNREKMKQGEMVIKSYGNTRCKPNKFARSPDANQTNLQKFPGKYSYLTVSLSFKVCVFNIHSVLLKGCIDHFRYLFSNHHKIFVLYPMTLILVSKCSILNKLSAGY